MAAWQKQDEACRAIVFANAVIHGARVVMCHTKVPRPWQREILARRPANVVAVALASKMARMAWAILARGQACQRNFVSVKPA